MADFIETDPASVQYVIELLQQSDKNRDADLAIRMIRSLAAEVGQLRIAANNSAPAGMIIITWQCAECGRNWTRAITPGFLPRYCPGNDGTLSACAITAKKRHDKATGKERQRRFRAKQDGLAQTDQQGVQQAITAGTGPFIRVTTIRAKPPELTQAQHHILNSVAIAQAEGKGANFTAREVQFDIGELIQHRLIQSASVGSSQYVLTLAGRRYLVDHLPLFGD